MNLTEDQIIEKYGKRCGHCERNMFLAFIFKKQYEWSCFDCAYNVVKRKQELSKIQRKNKFYK